MIERISITQLGYGRNVDINLEVKHIIEVYPGNGYFIGYQQHHSEWFSGIYCMGLSCYTSCSKVLSQIVNAHNDRRVNLASSKSVRVSIRAGLDTFSVKQSVANPLKNPLFGGLRFRKFFTNSIKNSVNSILKPKSFLYL